MYIKYRHACNDTRAYINMHINTNTRIGTHTHTHTHTHTNRVCWRGTVRKGHDVNRKYSVNECHNVTTLPLKLHIRIAEMSTGQKRHMLNTCRSQKWWTHSVTSHWLFLKVSQKTLCVRVFCCACPRNSRMNLKKEDLSGISEILQTL